LTAELDTGYVPSAVPKGEVTVNVAEPDAPGASASEAVERLPAQPAGTAPDRSKLDAEQDAVSLLVTVTVKAASPPEIVPGERPGERLTDGLKRAHDALRTTYVAEAVAVKVVADEFFAVAVTE